MKFVPVLFPNGDSGLEIDISDLDIPNKEQYQDILLFKMPSYGRINAVNKASKNDFGTDKWDNLYAVSNRLLESLPRDKAIKYVEYIVKAKKEVDERFITHSTLEEIQGLADQSLESAANAIAVIMDEMEQSMDLCDFIFQYITDNVPFALTEDAGLHAQDSPEMTWYPEQAHTLMTIVLLCKIVSPIYGAIISHLPGTIAGSTYRDMIAAQIMIPLLDRKYPAIIEKLKYYIRKIASRVVKEDKSSLMNGITVDQSCYTVFTALLARAYVNVNLMASGSNPITMTHVNIKKIISSKNQNAVRCKTEERRPPALASSDDDRIAQLEIDSMTSKTTADVVPITTFAVKDAIRRMMAKYDISDEDMSSSYAYYINHPIAPNCINKNMNSIFYGKDLGGSKGLLLLKADAYTQLTCLLQLILFSLDVNYKELGHMMTARPTLGVSSGVLNTNLLKMRSMTSDSFKFLRNRFESSPNGMKGRDWDKHIEYITEKLTVNKVAYNTSTYIWNWLEEPNLNGQPLDVTEKTIDAYCSMYQLLLELG